MFELLQIYGDIISNCILKGDYNSAILYQQLYKTLQKKTKAMKIKDLQILFKNYITLN